jgi:hypothetical protein
MILFCKMHEACKHRLAYFSLHYFYYFYYYYYFITTLVTPNRAQVFLYICVFTQQINIIRIDQKLMRPVHVKPFLLWGGGRSDTAAK